MRGLHHTPLRTGEAESLGTMHFAGPALSLGVPIQAKLAIGQPGDVYEREADAVAERVINSSRPNTSVQRKCSTCGQGEKDTSSLIHPAKGGGFPVSATLESSVRATKGRGVPLMDGTRSFMENAFSTDFSDVRIHSDGQAAEMSKQLQAKAFTHGSDIYFNQGRYNPETESGQRLLVHELTHVTQQGGLLQYIHRQEETIPDEESTAEETTGEEPTPEEETTLKEGTTPKGASPSDPCTYKGKPVQDREIHLNLSLKAVRVYAKRGGYTEFNNLITGPATVELARKNGWCHMYSVKGHQRLSGKGLINFVNYCGDFGFHSNFWKKDGKITVIPGNQSHGCARLHDADASSTASGDSNEFFKLVKDGDCVRIYARAIWRDPTFKPCGNEKESC